MTQEMPGGQTVHDEHETQHSEKTGIPEQVEALGETASKLYDQFRESEQYGKIQDTVTRTGEYIRNNPVPSVLYALGAGFVLGMLFHPKR